MGHPAARGAKPAGSHLLEKPIGRLQSTRVSDLWDDMKAYVGFAADDAAALRDFRLVAQPHFSRIVDDFYQRILRHPAARAVFTGGNDQVERLKESLIAWMNGGLAGPHDHAFFLQRAQIGRRHVQVGLPQRYMFTSMNVIRGAFHDLVEDHIGIDRPRARQVNAALDRLFDLELAVMLHTYQEDSEERLRQRERVAAVAQNEDNLRTLVDTVQALLLVLDRSGRVLHANPAVAMTTGVTPDRLVGLSWVDQFVHPQDRDEFRELLAGICDGGSSCTHDCRVLRYDDSKGGAEAGTCWVHWHGTCTQLADGSPRLYLSGLDVTSVRELERRVRLTQKLAAVGTLSAGLAHEIRNPINGANLQLELLHRRLRGLTQDDRIHSIADTVGNEINRVSRLIEDFLRFARPTDLMRQRIDVCELVRQVAQAEQDRGEAGPVEMVVDLPDGHVHVDGDHDKLQQVLSNLIRNSIEAFPAGGRIHLSVVPAPGGIELRVEDNGPGIRTDELDRVFEPFFSTKPAGTGLGLAICHSFVELHDGHISADSPPHDRDAGTRMTVWLPLAARDAEPTH